MTFSDLFPILVSENICVQLFMPVLSIFVMGFWVYYRRKFFCCLLALVIFIRLCGEVILYPQELRLYFDVHGFDIWTFLYFFPFSPYSADFIHEGNFSESYFFHRAIASVFLAKFLAYVAERLSSFFSSCLFKDFEGKWQYRNALGEVQTLRIKNVYEVKPRREDSAKRPDDEPPLDILLTPIPESLRNLTSTNGERGYAYELRKNTLRFYRNGTGEMLLTLTLQSEDRMKMTMSTPFLCLYPNTMKAYPSASISAPPLITRTVDLKSNKTDRPWQMVLKKQRMSQKDIVDGDALCDWFLGHPNFKPDIFAVHDETPWLEYKAGVRKRDMTKAEEHIRKKMGSGDAEKQIKKIYAIRDKICEWHVARALLGFSNSGGGLLILGFDEKTMQFLPLDAAYGEELAPSDEAEKFIRTKLLPWILPSHGQWAAKSEKETDTEKQADGSCKAYSICTDDKNDYELWRAEIRIKRIMGTDGFAFFVPGSPSPLRLIESPRYKGEKDESEWFDWVVNERNAPSIVLPIRNGAGASTILLNGVAMKKHLNKPRSGSFDSGFKALSLKLRHLLEQ